MENELSDLLALLMCWGFFILFIGCGIAGFIARARPLEMPEVIKDLMNDKIEIGYIDEVQPVGVQPVHAQLLDEDELSILKRQVEVLKLKKQLEDLKGECSSPKTDSTKRLMKDCIDALVAIGEKRSDAKVKAKNVFDRCPDIKTVDEFIKEAFRS